MKSSLLFKQFHTCGPCICINGLNGRKPSICQPHHPQLIAAAGTYTMYSYFFHWTWDVGVAAVAPGRHHRSLYVFRISLAFYDYVDNPLFINLGTLELLGQAPKISSSAPHGLPMNILLHSSHSAGLPHCMLTACCLSITCLSLRCRPTSTETTHQFRQPPLPRS